jgi:hypothetical protein
MIIGIPASKGFSDIISAFRFNLNEEVQCNECAENEEVNFDLQSRFQFKTSFPYDSIIFRLRYEKLNLEPRLKLPTAHITYFIFLWIFNVFGPSGKGS